MDYTVLNEFNRLVFLDRYADENMALLKEDKDKKFAILIGDSITENWANLRPQFFTDNDYVCRGISGQTSPQMLLRFRQDVIDLRPDVVVINIGTNDIAENSGIFDARFTMDNIVSMLQLALANDISVVLSSILPVEYFYWNLNVKNVPQIIDSLNSCIEALAETNKIHYINYNSVMRTAIGGLIDSYGLDGVHPNERGYEVMEMVAKPIIDKVLNER